MARRLVSISLAFTVLFSSTSWQLNLHLCGGEMVNWALWSKAEGCSSEEKSAPLCERHQGLSKKKCCGERDIAVRGLEHQRTFQTDGALIVPAHFDWNAPSTLLDYRFSVIESVYSRTPHWLKYKPPPPKRDTQAFLQVFRI